MPNINNIHDVIELTPLNWSINHENVKSNKKSTEEEEKKTSQNNKHIRTDGSYH